MVSTSTLYSCKDYDDDVNRLQEQVDDLSSLKAAKADVESAIASLKTQLEGVVGQETERAKAEAAALAARLATAESALNDLNTLISSKVDKSEYDAKVIEIFGKLEAVQTSLGSALTDISTLKSGLATEESARVAAIADLKQQIEALKLADINGYDELIAAIEALQTKTKDLNVQEIKDELQKLSDKIDALNADVNTLNVLVKASLRSLVFVPDAYYYGIEATKMLFLQNTNYKLTATGAEKKETVGYNNHDRFPTVAFNKVLDFTAEYHMNPSNADKASFKDVKLLDNDVDYVTRSSAAGLTVKNWDASKGILSVEIKASDATKIMTVDGNNKVTNFATQVTIAKGINDTTITSDYATVYTEKIQDLRLVHKAGSTVPFLGVKNTHDACPGVAGHTDNGRLMQTANEAWADFGPQDSCFWDGDLDLRKLVETHYTTTSGSHALLADPSKYGLKYKFELTGLTYGTNATSESAHAAINPADGYTFRPQMVSAEGKQQAYGAKQDRATTVGRTPLVRVSLVDEENENTVYDYGYIRIKIVDHVASPEADKYISYTASVVPVYNYECSPLSWSYNTTWNVTEYDLYNMLGITRAEFEANYGAPVYRSGTSGELKQYVYNSTTKKFTEATATQYYGTVTTITDVTSSEDETKSSTLWWNMTGAQVVEYFVTNNKKFVETAIKYESKNRYKYPDVWVRFNSGNAIVNKPSGAINWDPIKNPSYWYTSNTSTNGTDEMHNNVKTPEDNAGGKGDVMFKKFSDVMLNNNINPAKIITVSNDKTAGNEYKNTKLTLDLVFSSKNNGNVFKGNDGKSYWVRATDKVLEAHVKGSESNYTGLTSGWQTIATISGSNVPVDDQAITYNRESSYACELLNFASHNELDKDNSVIKAIVTVKAKNGCPMPLELDGKTFDVRFLRPINVASADKVIEDANTTKKQIINIHEIVKFTDWRDAWKPSTGLHGAYCTYYGIERIEIDGVADNESLSNSMSVKTNQSCPQEQDPSKWPSLKLVNNRLDFTYQSSAPGHENGILVYENFSSTVQEFKVMVPVVVTYYWGKIRTNVIISVKRTSANAQPRN